MDPFKTYIQTASTLCLYRLQQERICPSIYFPNVTTLALLRCSPEGVSNVIRSSLFPHLQQIHYLSLHPGDLRIHLRMKTQRIRWVFPQHSYVFYDNMVYANLGRKKEGLLSTYIDHFMPSTSFFIKLPGYHTKNTTMVMEGEYYRQRMMQYLVHPRAAYVQTPLDTVTYDATPSIQENVEKEFFNCMQQDARSCF